MDDSFRHGIDVYFAEVSDGFGCVVIQEGPEVVHQFEWEGGEINLSLEGFPTFILLRDCNLDESGNALPIPNVNLDEGDNITLEAGTYLMIAEGAEGISPLGDGTFPDMNFFL